MKTILKKFIAISSETFKDKLVYLNTSAGASLFKPDGISFDDTLDFLFDLIKHRDNQTGVVFVCYAFQRDNEFIFSTMPNGLKDKLFLAHTIKKEIEIIEAEQENLWNQCYTLDKDTQDYELADFERYTNKLALRDLQEVRYKDYIITLRNGKLLTLKKNKRSITIYDIYGFFQTDLRTVVKRWLDIDIPLLDRKIFNHNYKNIDQLKIYSKIEVCYVEKIATKLNEQLIKNGINLSRFQGAGALSSHILGKSRAKDSYHHYRYKRQVSKELHKAVFQSTYGGRSEQFKLGTLYNVKVYDINSAYGYACSYLPTLLQKPAYKKEWEPEPFSVWFCEYDFTDLEPYFGYLPNRTLHRTQYKLKGRGYFWQPEINFVLSHFPNCVKIGPGYVFGYERAPFALGIQTIYDLRKKLQDEGNPLEKVIKLALSGLYGKFAQSKGHFYNPFYSGFITSFTRTMLLEAVKFNERSTVCFQTDAIHTTATLPIVCDNEFGGYKVSRFDKVTYLDSGIYRAYKDGAIVKEKMRGFRHFDFDTALADLANKRTYDALFEFFVGHNLSVKNLFGRRNYLQDYKSVKNISPVADEKSAMRLFEVTGVDLTKTYFDSKIVPFYNGIESSIYRQETGSRSVDYALDTISAGRA